MIPGLCSFSFFFFFNDTATTEIYTLSLHDALPICRCCSRKHPRRTRKNEAIVCLSPSAIHHRNTAGRLCTESVSQSGRRQDRKSTRLNSSHDQISYAVFCLKKKNKQSIKNGRHCST